jgi:hypothetical protein
LAHYAIAELLGAVGVIASPVYLATRIRQSREQSVTTWLPIETAYFAVQFALVGVCFALVYGKTPISPDKPRRSNIAASSGRRSGPTATAAARTW